MVILRLFPTTSIGSMVVVCVVTRLHRLLVYGINCLNKPFLFDQNLIKESICLILNTVEYLLVKK